MSEWTVYFNHLNRIRHERVYRVNLINTGMTRYLLDLQDKYSWTQNKIKSYMQYIFYCDKQYNQKSERD